MLAIPLVIAAARIVSGGDHPEAAAKALTAAGHTVVEAGEIHRITHPLGMIALDAPKPKSWPADLPWDDVLSTCRTQAGPKPWTIRNSAAFLCGRQAATLLWQRYIDAQHADRVIEHAITHEAAGTYHATAIAYAASSTLTITAEASAATADDAVIAAVSAASKGNGAGGERELPKPLQKVVALPADTGPRRTVIVGGVCALPSSLELKNADDQASAAIAGAWAALDDHRKTGAPAGNCIVRQYESPAVQESTSTSLLGSTSMKSYTFDVACPGLPVVVTRQLARDDTQARLKGASKVAASLAKQWCKP